jgi:RimJ/RimL family protein N-acetyltransferase
MPIDYLTLSEQLARVHTPRLALRPAALCDAWPLFHATRNPMFNKHLLWDQPTDDDDVLARMDAIVEASRRGRLSAVSAVVKATGEWASLFRFQPYGANPRFVEMGVWTHDKFWHGRVSLELGRACVDAAFALSDIPVLIGAASPENRSSCKLMELCGLDPASIVLRQTESKTEVPLQEFRITREAWLARGRRDSFAQVALAQPRAAEPPPQSERRRDETYAPVVASAASHAAAQAGPAVADLVAAAALAQRSAKSWAGSARQ